MFKGEVNVSDSQGSPEYKEKKKIVLTKQDITNIWEPKLHY